MSWIRNKLSEGPKLDILTSINDIHNKLWNKQKVELVCLLGAKVGNVIKFREVELQLNNFVENYLPEKIDYFYKLLEKMESFDNLEDPGLLHLVDETLQLVKELHVKFNEVEQIYNRLVDESDKNDFQFCIDPAKKKAWDVCVCFLETHNSVLHRRKTKHRTTVKVRDLRSYLDEIYVSDNEENKNEENKVSESETDIDLNNDESYKEVPDKFKNHKELSELYSEIVLLHEIVEEVEDCYEDCIQEEVEDEKPTSKSEKVIKLVKTTALPTVCGVVGAITLGPLGAMAGAKIGGFATVLATTGGITGLITGYKNGQKINKRIVLDEVNET